MKRTILLVGFLIGGSLLAACSQATASTTSTTLPAVASLAPSSPLPTATNSTSPATSNCTLLSKDEVAAVLAESVDQVRDEGKGSLCVYQTQNMIFELTFVNPGAIGATQFLQNIQSINVNYVSVPGLGDEAFYNGSSFYDLFFVLKDGHIYTFGLRSSETSSLTLAPEDIQAKEKALAEALLTHLP